MSICVSVSLCVHARVCDCVCVSVACVVCTLSVSTNKNLCVCVCRGRRKGWTGGTGNDRERKPGKGWVGSHSSTRHRRLGASRVSEVRRSSHECPKGPFYSGLWAWNPCVEGYKHQMSGTSRVCTSIPTPIFPFSVIRIRTLLH